jgi:anti-sigma B factor antagonist
MQIDFHDHSPTHAILKLSGDIDLQNSSILRKEILIFLKKSPKTLIVHMGQVSYIDSSGITALLEGLQSAKNAHVGFILTDVSVVPMRVIQLARLDKIFTITPTLDDALAVS